MTALKSFHSLSYAIAELRDSAAAIAEEIDDIQARKRFAEAFCTSVIEHLWKSRVQSRKPRWRLSSSDTDTGILDTSSSDLAVETARIINEADAASLGYFVGTFYTTLLPESIRSQWGVYYTPPPLVERLLSLVSSAGLDWTTAHVIDPACGGAAFLAPVAARIWRILDKKAWTPAKILAHISSKIAGVEIDPFAAWMSQILTELRLLDLMIASAQRLPSVVRQGDSLVDLVRQGPVYDLVIGNPPYGKTALSSPIRALYSRSLYGHANLYGLFTDLALQIARYHGIVAYVTPTSFLSGQYFKALRNILAKEAPPAAIDFVQQRDVVFKDVLQETVLVVFQKRSRNSTLTRISAIDADKSNGRLAINPVARLSLARLGEKPWLLPRNETQRILLQGAMRLEYRLAHYGLTVATGQLVWNRNRDQLRSIMTSRSVPLIWAESVLPDGSFRFRSLRANHKPYFELRANQDHLVTREECLLIQRTTALEQRRRLICALLPESFIEDNRGGVVVENHLNIVRKSDGLLDSVSLRTLCVLLNSQVVDTIFRCISGSVAVSAYELNALPLPDPDGLCQLERLLSKHQGNGSHIESFIARLYGVT